MHFFRKCSETSECIRNKCVSLLLKAKKKHHEDLSIADVTDNKKFWKRVKPLFGSKIKGNVNIALVVDNNLITDEKSLAETFNDYRKIP